MQSSEQTGLNRDVKTVQSQLETVREIGLSGNLKIKDVVRFNRAGFMGRIWKNLCSLVIHHKLMSTRVNHALANVKPEIIKQVEKINMLECSAILKFALNGLDAKIAAKAITAKELNYSEIKKLGFDAVDALEIQTGFLYPLYDRKKIQRSPFHEN